jgi:hypothetical protein
MPGAIAKLRRSVIQQLLGELDFILVVVNPAHPGVELPRPLRESGQPVALHVGFRMALPIPDLSLGDEAIEATLSFNRSPHHCRIPWGSIVQITVEEEHLVWLCPDAVSRGEAREPEPESKPRLKLV